MRNFHVRVVDVSSCHIDLPQNMRVSQTCIVEDRYYYSVIDRTAVSVLYKYSLRNNSGYKEEADDCG
jgi:hypothetical protein